MILLFFKPGEVLPYKRLMAMCRLMGRIFTIELTTMGSHFQ